MREHLVRENGILLLFSVFGTISRITGVCGRWCDRHDDDDVDNGKCKMLMPERRTVNGEPECNLTCRFFCRFALCSLHLPFSLVLYLATCWLTRVGFTTNMRNHNSWLVKINIIDGINRNNMHFKPHLKWWKNWSCREWERQRDTTKMTSLKHCWMLDMFLQEEWTCCPKMFFGAPTDNNNSSVLEHTHPKHIQSLGTHVKQMFFRKHLKLKLKTSGAQYLDSQN